MYTNTYRTTDSTLPTFPTRKEARTSSLSCSSQGPEDFQAVRVDGVWAVVPKGYREALEDTGDTLPDTLEALEAGVREYMAVALEAVTATEEEAGTEDTPEEVEAPEDTPEEVEAPEARVARIRSQLAVLREQVRALEGELAREQVHFLVTSTVKGPVALVRDLFLTGVGEDGTAPRRRDVVNGAIKAGVAPNTAKTQYQVLSKKWANGDTALVEEWESLRDNMVVE